MEMYVLLFDYLYGDVNSPHHPGLCFGHPLADQNHWTVIQHQTDFSYYKNNKMHDGNAGQLLIIPPNYAYWHGARQDATEGFIDDWFYFKSDTAHLIFKELNIPIASAFDVSDTQLIRPYIQKMNLETSLKEIGYEHLISSTIYALIVKIARQHIYVGETDFEQKRKFDNIRREMLNDYGSSHTLEELAKKAGYSPGHFSAIYRRYYNISPIDDLLRYRLNIAKGDLQKGQLSVTEISRKCGFASIHHFSRFFKKHTGVSPSNYIFNEDQ